MRSAIAGFIVAMIAAALTTPLMRWFGVRIGAMSHPGKRHVHVKSTPRVGGVAIFVAFVIPLIGLFFVESSVAEIVRSDTLKVVGLLVGGAIMCFVGLVDDIRRLRAVHKLYAQVAVSLIAILCGFRIQLISLPFAGVSSMGMFAAPVTVLWIVGIINAVNLIDGLDGLAGGVVFFAAATNFIVAYFTGSAFVSIVMASMMGAIVGFLFYNFNPARIFMGDSGSYFLGYVLAVTSLSASQKTSTAVALLVPIVALGVPIFDTLFAMVRRILERRSIFSPDRGHIHHRLLDMGITHRRAVLIIYFVSILFAAAAIGISLGSSWQVGLALLSATVVIVGLVRFLGYFEYLHILRRQRAGNRARDVDLLRAAVTAFPEMLEGVCSEEEIVAAIQAAAVQAHLVRVGIAPRGTEHSDEASVWINPATEKLSEEDLVTVRCPIGADKLARADVIFAWQGDLGEASPQAEILLQVLIDFATPHFTRVRSELAPSTAAAAARADSEDDIAIETGLEARHSRV